VERRENGIKRGEKVVIRDGKRRENDIKRGEKGG